MADILLAGEPDENFGGIIRILEEKKEDFERVKTDIIDPEFTEMVSSKDFCVVLSRFHEGDLASIKAMQNIRMNKPYSQMIFITDKSLSASIMTLMFNEGAFGVLTEPLDLPHAWQLVKQAIKRAKWDLDQISLNTELRKLNDNLRERIERAEMKATRSSNLIEKLERLAHYLLTDKYFKAAKIKILVISAAAYQRNMVIEEFGKIGFEVKSVSSGNEALENFKAFKPDIVVSDLELEDMSGVDLSKKLKSDPSYPYHYFVITTSSPEKTEYILSPDTKVDDCVIKPSDTSMHFTMVARVALGLLVR